MIKPSINTTFVNPRILSLIFLVFASYFWGSTFLLVKVTVSIVPVLGFFSVRFLLSFVILLSYTLTKPELRKLLYQPKVMSYGTAMGIFLFSGYWIQTLGLIVTTPSKAAFITATSFIWIPLVGIWPFKRKFQQSDIVIILLGFVGVFFLLYNPQMSSLINVGDLLVLVSSVIFAYHVLISDKASSQEPIVLLTVQFFTMTFCAIILAIGSQEIWIPSRHPPVVWFSLFILVIFATIFAFFAQINALKVGIDPLIVGLVAILEPVFALVIDVIVGYPLTRRVIFGMVLVVFAILVGIYFDNMKELPESSLTEFTELEIETVLS